MKKKVILSILGLVILLAFGSSGRSKKTLQPTNSPTPLQPQPATCADLCRTD